MLAIQPIGGHVSDEELASIRAWAGVRHREGSTLMTIRIRLEFILEFIARTSASGAGGISTLNHEVRDDAVEYRPVIELVIGEEHEVVDSLWCVTGEQLTNDVSAGCLDRCRIGLGGVDHHGRGTGILVSHILILWNESPFGGDARG